MSFNTTFSWRIHGAYSTLPRTHGSSNGTKKSIYEEEHRYRVIPLTGDNIYNCELCGVRIAVLQIVTSGINDQEQQLKVCGTCLKEYIDQEAAEKK